jgi:hypothetical protein
MKRRCQTFEGLFQPMHLLVTHRGSFQWWVAGIGRKVAPLEPMAVIKGLATSWRAMPRVVRVYLYG